MNRVAVCMLLLALPVLGADLFSDGLKRMPEMTEEVRDAWVAELTDFVLEDNASVHLTPVPIQLAGVRLIGEVHPCANMGEQIRLRARLEEFRSRGYTALWAGWYGEEPAALLKQISYAKTLGYDKIFIGIGRLEPYLDKRRSNLYQHPDLWKSRLAAIVQAADVIMPCWGNGEQIIDPGKFESIRIWRDWFIWQIRQVDSEQALMGMVQYRLYGKPDWNTVNAFPSMSLGAVGGVVSIDGGLSHTPESIRNVFAALAEAKGVSVMVGPILTAPYVNNPSVAMDKPVDKKIEFLEGRGLACWRLSGCAAMMGRTTTDGPNEGP